MPTPAEAIAYSKRFVGSIPVDATDLKLRILNDAANKLWMAAAWRWTVGTVPVTALVNDTQDYTVTGFPADFLYYHAAQITDANNIYPMNICAALHAHTKKGRPERLTFKSGGFRVHPIPTGYSTLPYVLAWYKKKITAIATGNLTTELLTLHGLPEEWFQVYQDAVLLKAFLFDQDARAGSVQYSGGQVVYTGQYAVVEAGIQEMKSQENLLYDSLGIPIIQGGK